MNLINKIILLTCILLLSTIILNAQTFNRVNKISTLFASSPVLLENEIIDVKVDQQNNIYICGVFNGNLFLGTGTNQVLLTPSGAPFRDFYAAKFDSDQNLVWAKRITQGNALITGQFNGFDIDQNGNVYLIGGIVGGSKIFGFGEPNQTTLTGPPFITFLEGLFFIAKLNSINGNLEWVKEASSLDNLSNSLAIFGHDVVCDNLGNVIVVGQFNGTATFGALPPIISNNNTDADGFVVKYSQNNGNEIWLRKGPTGPLLANPNAVDVDGAGNIYYTGNFLGSSDIIGIGNIETVTVPVGSDFEMFVAKYDPNGEVLWANQSFSSIGIFFQPSTAGQNIATDLLGNSFITGVLQAQAISFGSLSGFGDINPTFYIAKINSLGSFEWAKQANFVSGVGAGSSGRDITIGSNGNPYISGNLSGEYSFDGLTITDVGGGSNFIVNYEKLTGQLICLKHPKPSTLSDQAVITSIGNNGNGNLIGIGTSVGVANYGNIRTELMPSSSRSIITLSEECCMLEDRIENLIYNDAFSFYGEDSKNILIAGFDAGTPTTNGDVIVNPNSNVIYTSEGRVTLKPGFRALNASKFKAAISDCGNTFTQNNNRLAPPNSNNETSTFNIIRNKSYKNLNIYQMTEAYRSKFGYIEEDKIDFEIFPNPNNGPFNVQLNNFISNENKISYIIITNVLGNVVVKKQINEDKYEFDLSNIDKGLYFIKVTIGEKSITKKIILN